MLPCRAASQVPDTAQAAQSSSDAATSTAASQYSVRYDWEPSKLRLLAEGHVFKTFDAPRRQRDFWQSLGGHVAEHILDVPVDTLSAVPLHTLPDPAKLTDFVQQRLEVKP